MTLRSKDGEIAEIEGAVSVSPSTPYFKLTDVRVQGSVTVLGDNATLIRDTIRNDAEPTGGTCAALERPRAEGDAAVTPVLVDADGRLIVVKSGPPGRKAGLSAATRPVRVPELRSPLAMFGVKADAMRDLTQEDADAAMANAESDFTRLQDRIREVPQFVEVAERFEEHRRAENPEDNEGK